MNALEAIGIDTSVAPEGYDENDTSNPYGRDSVTVNPVSELLLLAADYYDAYADTTTVYRKDQINSALLGHADGALRTWAEFAEEDTFVNILRDP